jgi:RNA polymerase sigma factor (sigma-70 family)
MFALWAHRGVPRFGVGCALGLKVLFVVAFSRSAISLSTGRYLSGTDFFPPHQNFSEHHVRSEFLLNSTTSDCYFLVWRVTSQRRTELRRVITCGGTSPMADLAILWPSTRPTLMLGIQDARNETAWSTFVDLYLPIVLKYCRKKGLQEADARDVTQNVIERVRRFIHTYNPSAGRFRGWLAAIARNETFRHFKKSKRGTGRGGIGNDDDDDKEFNTVKGGPDLDWDRIFDAHLLEKAIERVGPEFSATKWRAFGSVAFHVELTPQGKVLMRVENPDFKQVAGELGVKVAWVYKVKSEIMKRLMQEVLYLADEMALLL